MYIVLGGTGHVGAATAAFLVERGQAVTVVSRGGAGADEWAARGAQVALADVHDVESLRRAFSTGKRLMLINPPADPATDTDVEERKTGAAIVEALRGSGIERLVVQSTYGARAGERCGDLNTLYELERAVQSLSIPATILRAAYFMSNWDASLETAKSKGVVHSLFPADFTLPMVSPKDIGEVAARLLTEPTQSHALRYVEGPDRYTPADVAAAFSQALGRSVEVVTVPRPEWRATFAQMGFSEPAAESYTRMTSVTVDEKHEVASDPERGRTSLEQYVAELVNRDREPHHR